MLKRYWVAKMRIRAAKINGRKRPWNKNSRACTKLVILKVSTVSTNKIYQLFVRERERKRERMLLGFPFAPLLSFWIRLFLSSRGINQDKCLGNIAGWRLTETGNGSLWSDTDMYFVCLGEFFSTVLALITVFDIRPTRSASPSYKIPKPRPRSGRGP